MSNPPTVLVVEDDTDIRDTLVEVLSERGYAAVGASNGAEAIDRLNELESNPDLILLDLMMPVMDGREFRQTQLATPAFAEIPVLLMSAYHDVSQQAAELGVAFVNKPISVARLLDAVRAFCPPGS